MMFKKKQKVVSAGLVVLALGLMTGCTKASEDASGSVLVEGSLSTSTGSSKAINMASVSASAISIYEVYCVTFTQPPQSAVSALDKSGHFALAMPANTAFGCFVNDAETKTPVATVSVSGDDKGLGSDATTNLNITGNVNLGPLHLDLDKGEVIIPKKKLDGVRAPIAKSTFDIDDMNNASYKLSCVKTGQAVLDKRCQDEMEDGQDNSQVFFRVIKAMRDGKDIKGLGVWESETAYNDCGGIDLTSAKVLDLANNDGVTFPYAGVNIGAAYSVDNILCPLRDPNGDEEQENIRKNFALGEVVQDASGYTLSTHDFSSDQNDCQEEHTTVVHFSGKTANKLVGQLMNKSVYYPKFAGACDYMSGNHNDGNYLIELIKQ
jgi:hypothetical protein